MGTVGSLAGNAMALLVVKPLNSTGPVRTSEAPTTITTYGDDSWTGSAHTEHAGMPALKLLRMRPRAPVGVYDWERDDGARITSVPGHRRDKRPGARWQSWTLIERSTSQGREAAVLGVSMRRTEAGSGVEYRWSMPTSSFPCRPRRARSK